MTKIVSKAFEPLLVVTGDIEQDLMLSLTIEVPVEIASLKIDKAGRLVKADCSFEAAYNLCRLKGVEWDRMAGDEFVLKGIVAHQEAMRYSGGLMWASFELLQPGFMQLKMKPKLVISMFPEEVAAGARDH